jgi:hypothetical protein
LVVAWGWFGLEMQVCVAEGQEEGEHGRGGGVQRERRWCCSPSGLMAMEDDDEAEETMIVVRMVSRESIVGSTVDIDSNSSMMSRIAVY